MELREKLARSQEEARREKNRAEKIYSDMSSNAAANAVTRERLDKALEKAGAKEREKEGEIESLKKELMGGAGRKERPQAHTGTQTRESSSVEEALRGSPSLGPVRKQGSPSQRGTPQPRSWRWLRPTRTHEGIRCQR